LCVHGDDYWRYHFPLFFSARIPGLFNSWSYTVLLSFTAWCCGVHCFGSGPGIGSRVMSVHESLWVLHSPGYNVHYFGRSAYLNQYTSLFSYSYHCSTSKVYILMFFCSKGIEPPESMWHRVLDLIKHVRIRVSGRILTILVITTAVNTASESSLRFLLFSTSYRHSSSLAYILLAVVAVGSVWDRRTRD
jgi:hypothetical protein